MAMNERKVASYYDGVLNDTNFIDTRICSAVGMEFFLSELLFKKDLSRVINAKEDVAFRRRVELVGKDKIDSNFDPIGLDLPYAIYSQTGNFEPDDRPYTMQAGQIVRGHMQPETGINVKAAAVKVKYTATAFFARRDEVGVASQLLYWETQPKFPVYVIVGHRIAGWPIDVPVFITIDGFDADVNYQEKKYLADSRLFPIKIEMTVRSYQTLIESVDSGLKLPIRFSGLYGYNDEDVYFTHDTILTWADEKWTPDSTKALVSPWVDSKGRDRRLLLERDGLDGSNPSVIIEIRNMTQNPVRVKANRYTYETIYNSYPIEVVYPLNLAPGESIELPMTLGEKVGYDRELKTGPIPSHAFTPRFPDGIEAFVPDTQNIGDEAMKYFDRGDEGRLDVEAVDATVAYAVSGYFEPTDDVTLSELWIKEAGDDYLVVAWRIQPGQEKNFKKLTLYVPGVFDRDFEFAGEKESRFEGLYPASTYEFTAVLHSKEGGTRTYRLVGKTTGEEVIGDDVELRSLLLSRSWSNRPII